jgi:hypothetical protein
MKYSDLYDILNILIFMVIAAFGVFARELRFKEIKCLSLAQMCGNLVVATFGGLIVYFLCSMLPNIPTQMGYILSGLVGWGGPYTLDKIFVKQTGLKNEVTDKTQNNITTKTVDDESKNNDDEKFKFNKI